MQRTHTHYVEHDNIFCRVFSINLFPLLFQVAHFNTRQIHKINAFVENRESKMRRSGGVYRIEVCLKFCGSDNSDHSHTHGSWGCGFVMRSRVADYSKLTARTMCMVSSNANWFQLR